MIADVDLTGGLETAWEHVVTFAPKLLGFFLILLIGYFIAKAISKLVDSLLERVGFDGWVEHGAASVGAAFRRSNTEPSDVIGVIAFWTVFLIALQLAFGIWGPNPISELIQSLIAYLPNVIAAAIILVIAGAIARFVTDVLTPMLGAVAGGRWIARAAGIAILDRRRVRGARPAEHRAGDRDRPVLRAARGARGVDRRGLRRRRHPRRTRVPRPLVHPRAAQDGGDQGQRPDE